jgi:uncharacterized protein YecE (DUF72 family)
MYRIGTAGWSVPGKEPKKESHLHRYSSILSCVEINSSFYRSHRLATWARWAEETPPDFRFSIKAPKSITHENKLCNTVPLLDAFFEQIHALGEKTGPVLFQLPPSLSFERTVAEDFLNLLRDRYEGLVAFEPRHATWFTEKANELFKKFAIARVAADPAKGSAAAAEPGGDTKLRYYRLHGSPRIYYSSYDYSFLAALAAKLKLSANIWIVFDNTALSHAYSNALELQALLSISDFQR